MEFDFYFTLAVGTQEDAKRIDAKVAAIAGSLAHLSVLADSLERRPIVYRFTGRVSVPTPDPTVAKLEVLRQLSPHFQWNGRTFEWPPPDLNVSLAHPPLRGNWLFEDLSVEMQQWLLNRVTRFSVTGHEDRFDIFFEDDDHQRWLYELRARKPREENWRFVVGGLRQWLDIVRQRRKLRSDPEVDELFVPEPGEVVSFDLVPMSRQLTVIRNYGPNAAQASRFLEDAAELTSTEFDQVGRGWRTLAVRHITGPPDVNLHVANAMQTAQNVMALRKLLHDINPSAESELPVPTDDQLHLAVRAGQDAREFVATLTQNQDARDALAGMAGVLTLRPWIPEPLVENVLAPFVSVRPGWLERNPR